MSQHFTQLVADEIDDGLEIELRGHPLLDAVDDGELGRALLGFLQQPLRLVEQTRILERDAQAARERGQQSEVGVAECMLAVDVLDGNDAPGLVADDERHPDP